MGIPDARSLCRGMEGRLGSGVNSRRLAEEEARPLKGTRSGSDRPERLPPVDVCAFCAEGKAALWEYVEEVVLPELL